MCAGAVGEATRVGHHAGIDAFAGGFGEQVISLHGTHETEHHLAGRCELGVGECKVAETIGAEVMVYEYLFGFRSLDYWSHIVDAAQSVVVHGEDDIGHGKHQLGLVGVFVEPDDFLRARHPCQEVGVGVGHNHHGLLAQGLQVMCESQCGAQCIAIGSCMTGEYKYATFIYCRFQPLYIGCVEYISNHRCFGMVMSVVM